MTRSVGAQSKDFCVAGASAGCRTNHARASKTLHLVMSVFGAGAREVTVTGERINEWRRLGVGPRVAGRLLLFDLGYFKWQLFTRIQENGGIFVSRPVRPEGSASWTPHHSSA